MTNEQKPVVTLQRLLMDALEGSGVSTTQIVAATGLAESTVNQVRTGRYRGDLETWSRMLDAVGVEIGWRRAPA